MPENIIVSGKLYKWGKAPIAQITKLMPFFAVTFINEQKTNFRWEITPVKNRKLDVKYIDKDGGTEEQGEINVFRKVTKEATIYSMLFLLCRIVT